MAARKKGHVFRVTGLPASQPDDELDTTLKTVISGNLSDEEKSQLNIITAIVPSCYNSEQVRVALVEFRGGVPDFLSELVANPLGGWQVEMGDVDISFDQHFFGFTQLYTPKSDVPVTADIIAIAGLDGHAYGSWRSKGNLGRMWLRDFLSNDLPSCRTMIYGYNSKLSSHGIDTIMDYGRGLMEELKKIRNTEELRQRPLFFIAHSFGGILLAHCLVKAVQTTEDDHPTIATLHRATYGMLLFDVPHKGLQQIRDKSDLLASQLADFKDLIGDRKIVSFFKTVQTKQLESDSETKHWERTGEPVTTVETDSALLQLQDSVEEKIPLESDHSMIVKFDDQNNQGYISARDKLIQFEQDAPSVVAPRFSAIHQEHIQGGQGAKVVRLLVQTGQLPPPHTESPFPPPSAVAYQQKRARDDDRGNVMLQIWAVLANMEDHDAREWNRHPKEGMEELPERLALLRTQKYYERHVKSQTAMNAAESVDFDLELMEIQQDVDELKMKANALGRSHVVDTLKNDILE
ncbi:hypothetical protein FPRO04_13726 [Fusarium proliferatum]|nr:hypothetical protein FPRO04_13726 [Fusarium proliferatum]